MLLEETLRPFDALIKEGKVRVIIASNCSSGVRLAEALCIREQNGLARYECLQLEFNL
ncbi:hypothetical protein [Sodalis-like endosymbiont of Proechinophthirus fluctus]|uniref:hypothetical protein n=1 Tax=Sodalis-like endosymbiont of Proechinophthirus fluctus TaxID=1462730 RepID=UPI000A877AC0|nr:hypothetical protein [Sodalis-like endosymbiont of Proechinophthirus fluctus]